MRTLLSLALLAGCAITASAAPPTLELPAEASPVNGYVIVAPKTDAVSVTYVALDDVFPFPSDQLKDARAFVLPAAGLAEGRYRFVAVAAGKGGEQTTKNLVVVIGKGGTVPPPKKKEPTDPVDPVEPDAKFYFLVVRPDGPASAAFTKAMSLPEWNTLKAAGHKVKDRTATEATPILGAALPATQLPAVVTLVVSADGKSSTIVRPAVPLPTVGGAVLDLPKGVR